MAELLLELFSEEIPARMQARASADLMRLVCEALTKAGLDFDGAEAYVTPRRMILVVDGLLEVTPDSREERKGPGTSAPEKALEGFMRANGLTSISQAEIRTLPKGEFYFAIHEIKGMRTTDVLAELIPAALHALSWPKSMRWGTDSLRWVRPLHSIICLFEDGVVPFQFGPITSGYSTLGHRFLSSDKITVRNFADYKNKLRKAKVIIDADDRRALIEEQASKLAEAEGLVIKKDRGLLDEVTGLVEWPVPLMGSIDDKFMDVPQEVLITSMRSHQKYFSCLDSDGNLANKFIVVANTEADENGKYVRAGNERVLRARLSDAKFFWEQDQYTTLASKAPALKDRIFHAKLGTLEEKTKRMQALASSIAGYVDGADKEKANLAASLAKADLSSGMVAEFPDLQGVMGRYYAIQDGLDDDVATAIAEHYSPQGPGDKCPELPLSICVGLADKIDTLVGFFAIDEKPTGSKDPFALRRAALGVIRLILENNLRLPLRDVFKTSFELYQLGDNPADDLLSFFADRLKVHLKGEGVRFDFVDAVLALGDEDDLVRTLARVAALSEFVRTDDGENLLVAYRRAANILKIEEKKDDVSYAKAPSSKLLTQDEEVKLHASLTVAIKQITDALKDENFSTAMQALAEIRQPVDAFFDKVTVNCEDQKVRGNRLRLLSKIRSSLEGVADFSKIEG